MASGANGRPSAEGSAGGAALRLLLRNEFGIVAVEVCGPAGRQRLRISDVRGHASVELDPLELESLAWATHGDLAALLDPGLTRWQHEDG